MEKAIHSKEPQVRQQRLGEEVANAVSHGVGALLAIVGLVLLIKQAVNYGDRIAVVSVTLYGVSNIILYSVSCLYHSITPPRGKKVFQVLDHCSIFLLILGTYIPLALVAIGGVLGWIFFSVIAACAILGITLTAVSLKRWQKLSLVLYILMGWLGVFTIYPIYQAVSMKGILLLLLGGVAYTIGILFYKRKHVLYMHFIWHIFVLAGSLCHFALIYQYCCFVG